jgi:hypothetical protein
LEKQFGEAEEVLKENNLLIKCEESDKNKIVTKQIPDENVVVKENTEIIVHSY